MTGIRRHLFRLCVIALVLLALSYLFSVAVLIGPAGSGRPKDPQLNAGIHIFSVSPAPLGVWKRGFSLELDDPKIGDHLEDRDLLGFNVRTYWGAPKPGSTPPTPSAPPKANTQLLIAVPFGRLLLAFGILPVFVLVKSLRIRGYLFLMGAYHRERRSAGMDVNLGSPPACLIFGSVAQFFRIPALLAMMLVFVLSLFVCTVVVISILTPLKPWQYNSPAVEYSIETGRPGEWIGMKLHKPLLKEPHLKLRIYSFSKVPGAWRWFYSPIPDSYFECLQADELRSYTDGTSEYHTSFTVDLPVMGPFIAAALYIAAFAGWFWAGRRLRRTDACLRCNYNLTGNESGVCSECGLFCVPKPIVK